MKEVTVFQQHDCREGHSKKREQKMPRPEAGVCLACCWNDKGGRWLGSGDSSKRGEQRKWGQIVLAMMRTLPCPLREVGGVDF